MADMFIALVVTLNMFFAFMNARNAMRNAHNSKVNLDAAVRNHAIATYIAEAYRVSSTYGLKESNAGIGPYPYIEPPLFNHTKGDGPLTPCALCMKKMLDGVPSRGQPQ